MKFNDLKLKDKYNIEAENILNNLNKYENLITVHIRQTDYQYWRGGMYYFNCDFYMKKCYEKIKEWGIKNYKILIFSDSDQNIIDNNSIFISNITNFVAPIDLFIMSNCNYFISTQSTFSIMAMNLSKSIGKFKNNFVIE